MLLKRECKFNRNVCVALGGIVTALCTSLMILSGVMPIFGYVFPASCGIIILLYAIESEYKWGLMSFFAVSLLSILLSADKSSAVLFLMFLGYYPLIKLKIEKIKIRIIRAMCKALIFNTSIITQFLVTISLFKVPEKSLILYGVPLPLIMLVGANFTFIMYDRCISNMVVIYFVKFQKTVRRIMSL